MPISLSTEQPRLRKGPPQEAHLKPGDPPSREAGKLSPPWELAGGLSLEHWEEKHDPLWVATSLSATVAAFWIILRAHPLGTCFLLESESTSRPVQTRASHRAMGPAVVSMRSRAGQWGKQRGGDLEASSATFLLCNLKVLLDHTVPLIPYL